jgi:hypothetical protein
MSEHGEWNRKGATLSDVTAEKEYGLTRCVAFVDGDGRRLKSPKGAGGLERHGKVDAHRRRVFRHIRQNDDPMFALQVEEAAQAYRESIQAEIYRRGMIGWDEPICGKDSVITPVRRFSDRMLELEAKAAWPARYRENHTTGDDLHRGGVLVVGENLEPGEWDKRAAIALQRVTDEPESVPKLTQPVKPSD